MSPELEKVQSVMVRYAEIFTARYKMRWVPTNEHIAQTLELLKSPLPGFAAYTAEDLCDRLDAFFACKEDWLVASRHNYSVFLKHIHRWEPRRRSAKVTPVQSASTVITQCSVHPDLALAVNEICPLCFPVCSECHEQHAPSEDCETVRKRLEWVKRTFNGDAGKSRDGNPRAIDGTKALSDQVMKSVRELRVNEDRQRSQA